jgi:hypothetical protein
MKQPIKLVLFWLLITLISSANHVQWLGDYDTALQLAHKESKPLLVLVIKHKDPLSNTIIKNHFMNHDYVDKINQKMIAVIVTYEGRSSYPIEMYYTRVFPTLFFVNTQTETFMREPLYGAGIKTGVLKKIISTL